MTNVLWDTHLVCLLIYSGAVKEESWGECFPISPPIYWLQLTVDWCQHNATNTDSALRSLSHIWPHVNYQTRRAENSLAKRRKMPKSFLVKKGLLFPHTSYEERFYRQQSFPTWTSAVDYPGYPDINLLQQHYLLSLSALKPVLQAQSLKGIHLIFSVITLFLLYRYCLCTWSNLFNKLRILKTKRSLSWCWQS